MEDLHTEIIYYLAKIGKRLGFRIWVGLKEQGNLFGQKKLANLCDETNPSLRFTPSENLERIKQIDVLWYDNGEVQYEFEVENTTGITEAIVRGSNILTETTKRYIVLPKERENLLHKKLQEPLFSQMNEISNWSFLFYRDIEYFFHKKKLNINDINDRKRIPKSKEEIQQTLISYF